MPEPILRKLLTETEALGRDFSASCAYRTCHYRHALIDTSLKTIGVMAAELSGDLKRDELRTTQLVRRIAWELADAVSDVDGDAHLYGVLREVEEVAHRVEAGLLRKKEEEALTKIRDSVDHVADAAEDAI